ncbi:MAG: anti-sigma F factor [Thermaerobacterales bacterium]
MGTDNFFTLEMQAIPENVGIARLAVAAFASQLDFTLNEIEEIKVAVSEAVTNAVVHAYPVDRGVVSITASLDGGRLVLRVSDEGVGIADVERAREPSYSSDPERMGMGFAFMEAFMDTVAVESAPGGGTTVSLQKRPARIAVSGQKSS